MGENVAIFTIPWEQGKKRSQEKGTLGQGQVTHMGRDLPRPEQQGEGEGEARVCASDRIIIRDRLTGLMLGHARRHHGSTRAACLHRASTESMLLLLRVLLLLLLLLVL